MAARPDRGRTAGCRHAELRDVPRAAACSRLIEAYHARCAASGVRIARPLAETAWGTKDFCVEDPDGNVVCLGGRPAASSTQAAQPM